MKNLENYGVQALSTDELATVDGGDIISRVVGWIVGGMQAAYTPNVSWAYGYGPRY